MTHLAVSAPSTLSRSRHRGGLPTFVGLAIPKGERQMFKEITYNRRCFLGTAVMSIAAAQLGMIGCAKEQSSEETQEALMSEETTTAQLPIEGELSSLGSATEWLNSQPLTTAGLRGKVVLIDFWTYTCINWLRSLPYVRAWAEKYKDQGLVVIGVHTPEFAFE